MFETDIDHIIITMEEEGLRLDKILVQRFSSSNKSRSYFQYLIDDQKIFVNGVAAKKSTKPSAGDEVEIHFVITPELKLVPEAIPLTILYEDSHLLIIDKAPGMVVHPAVGNWSGTFVNALLHHCSLAISSDHRPGIVHRLDKDTSGVLLAAKTRQAQQTLIEMFSSRQIKKDYLAVCLGNPGNIVINQPIGRHMKDRKLMAVVESGRNAITICKTIATDNKISLVDLELCTGRTHQIRVHLKHIGTPVLGDATYGRVQMNEKYGALRQLLHAKRLRFNHPITGVPMDVEAPIPDDMKPYVDRL